MKTQGIDVRATIQEATSLLENETGIPPAFRSVFKLLILLVKILADKNSLNSRNSSKPPSSDPNREKKKKSGGKKKPGRMHAEQQRSCDQAGKKVTQGKRSAA